jgi:hypothetical protein
VQQVRATTHLGVGLGLGLVAFAAGAGDGEGCGEAGGAATACGPLISQDTAAFAVLLQIGSVPPPAGRERWLRSGARRGHLGGEGECAGRVQDWFRAR